VAPILAQSGGAGSSQAWSALAWVGVLVALLVVGALIVMALRRSLMRDQAAPSGDPFSLDELRKLKASGALSDDEFDRARAALLGRHAETRSSPETHGSPGPRLKDPAPRQARRDHG